MPVFTTTYDALPELVADLEAKGHRLQVTPVNETCVMVYADPVSRRQAGGRETR